MTKIETETVLGENEKRVSTKRLNILIRVNKIIICNVSSNIIKY